MGGLVGAVLQGVLISITVVGNALVLVAFAVRPALRNTRSNVYIASLGKRTHLPGLQGALELALTVKMLVGKVRVLDHSHIC